MLLRETSDGSCQIQYVVFKHKDFEDKNVMFSKSKKHEEF